VEQRVQESYARRNGILVYWELCRRYINCDPNKFYTIMDYTEAHGNYKSGWQMAGRLLSVREMHDLKTSVDTMYHVLGMISKTPTAQRDYVTLLGKGVVSVRRAIKYMHIWKGTYGDTSNTEQCILVMKVLKVSTALMLDINILLKEDPSGLDFFREAAFNLSCLSGSFLPNYDNLVPQPSYLLNLPDSYTVGGTRFVIDPPRNIFTT
jgi:hypothetical protein